MRREWTEQEERYMEMHYIYQPIEKTAKALNRTIESVKRKAARMKLNHYTSFYNAKTLAKCFNSDVTVVLRWIQKFNLPARKVVCETQTRYLINPEKFWKWAEERKEIINWSKYEIGSVLPEPDWVKNEKRNYNQYRSRERFTEKEISTIKGLLRRNLSYREIAEIVGRSYYSINHICRNIYRMG